MIYYRTIKGGERVYIAEGKHHASVPVSPGEMIYRVRDGHALWGYTREDIITEAEWLKQRNKK